MRPALFSSLPLSLLAGLARGQDLDIYAAFPRTPKGCTCASTCSSDALFDCFSEEVCAVASQECANGTAEDSVSKGYWDYCEHPAYEPYESLSAAQKEALLLGRIRADDESGEYPNQMTLMPGIMSESVRVSFEAQSDIFTRPRTKYIHSVGSVAPIRWESSGNHSYDGLFASGAQHGLIRFSSANDPFYLAMGFTPGVALKLFRDGRPSANIFAMPSLDGQSCLFNSNFFERDFQTHVEPTGNFFLQLLARKFWQASYCPLMIGTAELADGSDRFPFMLKLKPASGLKVECPCMHYQQCLDNLGDVLKPGDEIFEVHAQSAPKEDFELIGRIRVGGASPVRSKFGDMQLFFKHQAMEEDFRLHPDWLEKIDKEKECGMKTASTTRPGPEVGCSSPIVKSRLHDEEMIV